MIITTEVYHNLGIKLYRKLYGYRKYILHGGYIIRGEMISGGRFIRDRSAMHSARWRGQTVFREERGEHFFLNEVKNHIIPLDNGG